MSTVLRFRKLVLRPTGHHFLAMDDIVLEDGFQIENLRIDTVDQRKHVHVEILLEVGQGIKLVQNFLRIGLLLELDHDTDTVLVGLVAQVADTHEPALLHEIGDLLDERGFVRLIGDLGDDDLERPAFVSTISAFARVAIRPFPVAYASRMSFAL
jgi:hypothetical protein